MKIGDYFFTGVYHDSQFYWRENRGETTYLVASYLTTLTPKVILSTPPHGQDSKPKGMRDRGRDRLVVEFTTTYAIIVNDFLRFLSPIKLTVAI